MRRFLFSLLALAALAAPLTVNADKSAASASPEKHSDAKSDSKASESDADKSLSKAVTIPNAASKPVISEHTAMIAGKPFAYRAEVGMLPIISADGKVRASVFYTAYTQKGDKNSAARPITFCFNGGPGAASVWLHLGGLGPRIAKLNADGTLPAPPFQIIDNHSSILDATDLVFIDPVSTGFSRATKDEKPDQFHGVEQDISTVGDFIRLYTTRRERWLSPKYLCGESYGVFRAAGLSQYLQDRCGMYLNGLILMSGIIDYATIEGGPNSDLSYITFLPSYATTAHYFKKLPPDLQKLDDETVLAAAQKFANGEYASALLAGSSLPAAERKHVAEQLARFTGLPLTVIEDNNLRVDPDTFRKKLLLDQNLIIGRYDARITGRDGDRAANSPGFDPSFAAALGPISAAFNAYIRTELKYEDDLPYNVLTNVQPWQYPNNRFASVTEPLAAAISENPHMRILVLQGLRDLACPIGCMKYSIEHLKIAPQLLSNFQFEHYQAGHMMYLNQPDRQKLHSDIDAFLR